jgi:hypothetical protein
MIVRKNARGRYTFAMVLHRTVGFASAECRLFAWEILRVLGVHAGFKRWDYVELQSVFYWLMYFIYG